MTVWSEGYVQANGINIHYHRTGGDGKPAILLLHGITDSGLCWSVVAHDLEDRYDVIMTDARGHGRSDRLTAGFSIDILADDAAAVIRALGLKKPYLFGHSMGAITAASVAANYPDLVRAVILEDPPLLDRVPAPNYEPQQDETDRPGRSAVPDFRAMSREERIATALAMNPGWSEAENIPWAESKAEYDPAILQHFTAFQGYPWREVLARIECPVLLITGDPAAGAIVAPEVAQEAAGIWQNGEVVQISDAGHCIHRDRYAETMKAVETFLHQH